MSALDQIASTTTADIDDADAALEAALESFTATKVVVDTGPINITVNPAQVGNIEVDLFRAPAFLGRDFINALAQASARNVAMQLAQLQNMLFGPAMIAEDKCPSVDTAFDDDAELLPEYAEGKSPGQILALERRYATVTATLSVGEALKEAWDQIFENAPAVRDAGPRFGLERMPAGSRQAFEPILSFHRAIQYYLAQRPEVTRAKHVAEADRQAETHRLVSGARAGVRGL